MEGAVGIARELPHRNVEALDRIRGVHHPRQVAQQAERLDERAQVVVGCRAEQASRDIWRERRPAAPRGRPHAAAVRVEHQAAPVRGRAGAHVHHRSVAQPAAEAKVDGVGRTLDLHQRQRRILDLAFELAERRQRDDQRTARKGLRLGDEEEGQDTDASGGEQRGRRCSDRQTERRAQAAQVRRGPEARKADEPRTRQHSEQVVPRVNGG